MAFAAPAIPTRKPPFSAIEECARKGRKLPAGGRDPCGGARRKLDLLWCADGAQVPIEIKLVVKRKADVHGYYFLRDIHRLERLCAVVEEQPPSDARFAVFAACEPLLWTDGPPEPVPFRLFEGRTTEPGF